MSRCYPYPPPGYDKKANVALALSVKKEKHKHKDKKKKRRKDNETNGDLPRDLDKRSKRSYQVGVIINEDLTLENGSFSDATTGPSDRLHENTIQRLPAGSVNAEVVSDGGLTRNGKGHDMLRKSGQEPSLVPEKVAVDSNGILIRGTIPSSGSKVNLSEDKPTQYVLHVEKNWSPVDDEEWLFHHSAVQKGAEPGQKMNESKPPVVLAEAIFLPSVGIYALPYVIPD